MKAAEEEAIPAVLAEAVEEVNAAAAECNFGSMSAAGMEEEESSSDEFDEDSDEEAVVPDRLTARRAYYVLKAMWTAGGCTPQNVSLKGVPFEPTLRERYEAEEALYPDCSSKMDEVRYLNGMDGDALNADL